MVNDSYGSCQFCLCLRTVFRHRKIPRVRVDDTRIWDGVSFKVSDAGNIVDFNVEKVTVLPDDCGFSPISAEKAELCKIEPSCYVERNNENYDVTVWSAFDPPAAISFNPEFKVDQELGCIRPDENGVLHNYFNTDPRCSE